MVDQRYQRDATSQTHFCDVQRFPSSSASLERIRIHYRFQWFVSACIADRIFSQTLHQLPTAIYSLISYFLFVAADRLGATATAVAAAAATDNKIKLPHVNNEQEKTKIWNAMQNENGWQHNGATKYQHMMCALNYANGLFCRFNVNWAKRVDGI